jgi:phosphosulfolactate synthase
MSKHPFDFIELPAQRSVTKPRANGLTMMIDWGLGLMSLEDTLEISGDYIDLGKIAVGTPRLYDQALLKRKFDLYASHQVRPFLGGMFIEHYYETNGMEAMPQFYAESKRVGFKVIEVSDNLRPFTSNERRNLIQMALDHGLTVFGEVGAKWETNDAATLIAQAEECFEAGCELVLVEGAELVDSNGEPMRDLLDALRQALDLDHVLFELPGPWISGCTMCAIHDLKKLLITEFGANVNIANVMPEDVMETEVLRAGLSVIHVSGGAKANFAADAG